MKIVIPGGAGQVGGVLARALLARGHDVIVLSRGGASAARVVRWDGRSLGTWASEIDGADAVINLAGRGVEWLLERDDVEGPVNLAAPEPLPQREFMRDLRAAVGTPFGIGGTKWMLEIAAVLHRTDTELLLKSRRVVPGRLLGAGFRFGFPSWPEAARDLVARWVRT